VSLELILFISLVALVSNVASLWVFGYVLRGHKKRILEIYSRIDYLEAGMSYHELLPMPWEIEYLDDDEQTKNFKREGNVVYLQKDE
jgi:hypothetical protein